MEIKQFLIGLGVNPDEKIDNDKDSWWKLQDLLIHYLEVKDKSFLPSKKQIDKHFKFPKKTGEAMFQFDNSEAVKICDIFDYGDFNINLQQQRSEPNGLQNKNPVNIEFTSAMNEKFKLFIKDCL